MGNFICQYTESLFVYFFITLAGFDFRLFSGNDKRLLMRITCKNVLMKNMALILR